MTLQYGIPDLSHLPMHGGTFALNKIFGGGGPKDYRAYALAANFIRLTDLALREYELGREFVEGFTTQREHVPIPVVATNHFETCIVALKRAIDFLAKLKGSLHVPMSLKALLPKQTAVLSSGVKIKITDMRDAIQHLENRILEGAIAEGEPLMLAFSLDKDSLGLGSKTIRYADLASWIRSLNVVAESVARYRENGPTA